MSTKDAEIVRLLLTVTEAKVLRNILKHTNKPTPVGTRILSMVEDTLNTIKVRCLDCGEPKLLKHFPELTFCDDTLCYECEIKALGERIEELEAEMPGEE